MRRNVPENDFGSKRIVTAGGKCDHWKLECIFSVFSEVAATLTPLLFRRRHGVVVVVMADLDHEAITSTYCPVHYLTIRLQRYEYSNGLWLLTLVFATFFGSQQPCLVKQQIGGTLAMISYYTEKVSYSIIGGAASRLGTTVLNIRSLIIPV